MQDHRRLYYLAEALFLFALAGLCLWLRWPALGTEGFHNEDAAGITYNADLLLRGLLPYKDAFEVKAPGSFFLSWMGWEVFGRSIVTLQRLVCGWAILGAFGIYFGGRLLYGVKAGVVAALLYALCSPITDSIDINYGAWMVTPYIWATVLFIAGQKTGKGKWYFAAGLVLAIAGVMKRQAAVGFPVLALVLLVAPYLQRPEGWAEPGDRRKDFAWLFGGLAAGFAPIIVFYFAKGGGMALIDNYFFSRSGWRYAKTDLEFMEKLVRVGDGFLGFWEYMATATLLAGLAFVAAARPGKAWTTRGLLLGTLFWMSFVGASIGFRYFKGYYLQILPAAVWIAAHPEGPIGRWLSKGAWATGRVKNAVMILLLMALLVPAAMNDVGQLNSIQKRRKRPLDLEAQKVAKVINDNLPADQEGELWVWGRWAWPVYFHTERRSATRFFKVLAVITTNLTNTWRRPTKKTRFNPDGPWRELMDELEEAPPRFIVISTNEDYGRFKVFHRFLSKQYKHVRGVGKSRFRLYRHKEQAMPKPPRAAKKKRKRLKKKARKKKKARPLRFDWQGPRQSKARLGPIKAPK